jgi:hypothetical protein
MVVVAGSDPDPVGHADHAGPPDVDPELLIDRELSPLEISESALTLGYRSRRMMANEQGPSLWVSGVWQPGIWQRGSGAFQSELWHNTDGATTDFDGSAAPTAAHAAAAPDGEHTSPGSRTFRGTEAEEQSDGGSPHGGGGGGGGAMTSRSPRARSPDFASLRLRASVNTDLSPRMGRLPVVPPPAPATAAAAGVAEEAEPPTHVAAVAGGGGGAQQQGARRSSGRLPTSGNYSLLAQARPRSGSGSDAPVMPRSRAGARGGGLSYPSPAGRPARAAQLLSLSPVITNTQPGARVPGPVLGQQQRRGGGGGGAAVAAAATAPGGLKGVGRAADDGMVRLRRQLYGVENTPRGRADVAAVKLTALLSSPPPQLMRHRG